MKVKGRSRMNGQVIERVAIHNDVSENGIRLLEGDDVVAMMNPTIYAMRELQKEMEGEWEKAGIFSEDDINELCRETREEIERL